MAGSLSHGSRLAIHAYWFFQAGQSCVQLVGPLGYNKMPFSENENDKAVFPLHQSILSQVTNRGIFMSLLPLQCMVPKCNVNGKHLREEIKLC